jgi:hypothetical protein
VAGVHTMNYCNIKTNWQGDVLPTQQVTMPDGKQVQSCDLEILRYAGYRKMLPDEKAKEGYVVVSSYLKDIDAYHAQLVIARQATPDELAQEKADQDAAMRDEAYKLALIEIDAQAESPLISAILDFTGNRDKIIEQAKAKIPK